MGFVNRSAIPTAVTQEGRGQFVHCSRRRTRIHGGARDPSCPGGHAHRTSAWSWGVQGVQALYAL